MHAGRRLLGNTLDLRGYARPALRIAGELFSQQIENDAPLLRLVARLEFGNATLAFACDTLMNEQCGVATVVHNERRSASIRPHQCL